MPEGWIPYTTYFLYINDIPVGYGRVRHTSSEYLENFVGAGNLGYGISKEYRGKGYGNILFTELLKKCKDFGYKEIKLFPLKSNKATVKIMIKNGGKIIGDFKDEKHIISIQIKQKVLDKKKNAKTKSWQKVFPTRFWMISNDFKRYFCKLLENSEILNDYEWV